MVCEKEEDVEKRKKWAQDELFVLLGERVHLPVYSRTQKWKEGATPLEQCSTARGKRRSGGPQKL